MPQISDLFSARVPRYTSYPTAPHFHAGVTGDVFRQMAGSRLPDGMPLSLYLHVPFCDTLCWFCGCHTKVVNHYSPRDGLSRTCCSRRSRLVAAIVGPGASGDAHPLGRRLADHAVAGRCCALGGRASRRISNIAPDAEFAIEIDPRGLEETTMIAALAEAGVNRASIGVQDCDEKVQRAINRIQTVRGDAASAVERLRAAGIAALNIDLIYGLPLSDAGEHRTHHRDGV